MIDQDNGNSKSVKTVKINDAKSATKIDPKVLRTAIEKSAKDLKKQYTKSDQVFKQVMSTDITAREFVQEYLPMKLKDKVDLSTLMVEKESFVEPKLKKRLSDIDLFTKNKRW